MKRKRSDGYPEPIREMLAYTSKLQRQEGYFNLIDKLLDCEEGQEKVILNNHLALIDQDFLDVLEQRAIFWEAKEMFEIADYLRTISKIASEISNK